MQDSKLSKLAVLFFSFYSSSDYSFFKKIENKYIFLTESN